MSDIFHVHTGVRRQTVKASMPKGQGEVRYKALMPNEATTPRLQPWSVVYDPSETLRASRFTKMDIMFGVEYGCWEHGTLFQHLVLGHYLYFDKKEGRVRRLREIIPADKKIIDAARRK